MASKRGFSLKNVGPVFNEVDASRLRAQTEFDRLARTIIPHLVSAGPEKTGDWKRGWKVMKPRQLKHGVKVKLQNRVPYVRMVEYRKRKGGLPWSEKGYMLFRNSIKSLAMLIKG